MDKALAEIVYIGITSQAPNGRKSSGAVRFYQHAHQALSLFKNGDADLFHVYIAGKLAEYAAKNQLHKDSLTADHVYQLFGLREESTVNVTRGDLETIEQQRVDEFLAANPNAFLLNMSKTAISTQCSRSRASSQERDIPTVPTAPTTTDVIAEEDDHQCKDCGKTFKNLTNHKKCPKRA